MLYFVGLGLGDAKDITVKGLEVVKKCKRVYLEAYTSILTVGKDALEEFYGREIILADRDMVETNSDEILSGAEEEDVAFLVVGDPFGPGAEDLSNTKQEEDVRATTHTDLVLRAKEKALDYRVVHNASIMNACGCCGLQLYNFGETVSIVFWTDTWKPDSYYDKIKSNRDRNMHTLCLLDIKMKEQTIENLMKGRKIFEPPRFMTVKQASEQLLEIVENKRQEGEDSLAFTEDTVCVGLSRVGSDAQRIVSATLQEMTQIDLGEPLHSLIIPGEMHSLERDMLLQFAISDKTKNILSSLCI